MTADELRGKICIFGAGAIGSYVAAQPWRTGNDVCVVARGPSSGGHPATWS